jgi:hypothetical protein
MDVNIVNTKINEHYANRGRLRREICEAIHDMLTELGGTVKFIDDEHEEDCVYFCYDGGNHVEYDSTMNCQMDSVSVSIGGNKALGESGLPTFTFDCERENNVEEWRLMFDDLCAVFDIVYSRYNEIKGLE